MFKRFITLCLIISFILGSYQPVYAQDFNINQLPVPGTMVGESAPFTPLALKGLVINPQKPLEFQFIIDTGSDGRVIASEAKQSQLKQQANQLVKYFLAGLTIPEGDIWVNLSPYEKNRMLPEALGQTDLGRDLLAQDYILKQLTASLIYPEKDLGKEFWSKVYARAQQQFGTTNVPVNTFNKVWILPDQAQVFEHGPAAYVTKATLKVMLDEDYLALQKHSAFSPSFVKEGVRGSSNDSHSIASQIIREIVLPEITKEVNTGKNFAPLRQIYQALILAKWYKQTIQNGFLDALYTNKNKVAGVNLNDPAVKEQIYNRYLQAYKKGAFNYIKEDFINASLRGTSEASDEAISKGTTIPRKYFSGGEVMVINLDKHGTPAMISHDGAIISATVGLVLAGAAVGGPALKALLNLKLHKAEKNLQKQVEANRLARQEALNEKAGHQEQGASMDEVAKSLKPGEIATIEAGKVIIHEANTTRLSGERALLEINEALDQRKLTPNFKKSWDFFGKHMSQLGLGFAPITKDLMKMTARLVNLDEKVLFADSREIVPISEFNEYDFIDNQTYRFGWDGLDKQRHGIWVVFPRGEGDAAMNAKVELSVLDLGHGEFHLHLGNSPIGREIGFSVFEKRKPIAHIVAYKTREGTAYRVFPNAQNGKMKTRLLPRGVKSINAGVNSINVELDSKNMTITPNAAMVSDYNFTEEQFSDVGLDPMDLVNEIIKAYYPDYIYPTGMDRIEWLNSFMVNDLSGLIRPLPPEISNIDPGTHRNRLIMKALPQFQHLCPDPPVHPIDNPMVTIDEEEQFQGGEVYFDGETYPTIDVLTVFLIFKESLREENREVIQYKDFFTSKAKYVLWNPDTLPESLKRLSPLLFKIGVFLGTKVFTTEFSPSDFSKISGKNLPGIGLKEWAGHDDLTEPIERQTIPELDKWEKRLRGKPAGKFLFSDKDFFNYVGSPAMLTLTRRQFLGILAIGMGARKLLAQQGKFRQEGPVWDDFVSAISKEHIKLSGPTDQTIYQEGSSHPARKTLQIIQNYCDALYVALITLSPQMEQIIKLQEDSRKSLEEIIGKEKLSELAEGEDLSKMGFTKFMLTIVNRYLAQYNIIMFGVILPVARRDSVNQVVAIHACRINNVEKVDIGPEDLWGQALSVNRVMVGNEISINGRPINRMKAGLHSALAEAAYGNMFFFQNELRKQYGDLTTIGGNADDVERQFEAIGYQNTAEQAREANDETSREIIALKFSVNMVRIALARLPQDDVVKGGIEQVTRHEGKHLIDNHNQGHGVLSAALEVDGHLAGMRKNDVGWVQELTDTYVAKAFPTNSLATQSTDIAQNYNLKKIVEYILVHRSDFPMIEGEIFDKYTVLAQLYKITDINLRRKIIDAVYRQHQKEYGHEEEVLQGASQTVWDDQKVIFGLSKTVVGGLAVAVASAVGVGAFLKWRSQRMKAKHQLQTKSPVSRQQRRHQERKKKSANKKNPRSDAAMLTPLAPEARITLRDDIADAIPNNFEGTMGDFNEHFVAESHNAYQVFESLKTEMNIPRLDSLLKVIYGRIPDDVEEVKIETENNVEVFVQWLSVYLTGEELSESELIEYINTHSEAHFLLRGATSAFQNVYLYKGSHRDQTIVFGDFAKEMIGSNSKLKSEEIVKIYSHVFYTLHYFKIATISDAAMTIKDKKILIVDDGSIYRDELRESLEREGANVTEAEGGAQALEILKENNFDLVVTDKQMPGMDGKELVKEIKTINPNMPIIMWTSDESNINYLHIVLGIPVVKKSLRAVKEAIEKLPDRAMLQSPKVISNTNPAENGGIDLNKINVLRTGKTISVQFDPAQLSELEQSNFKGFTPVITGFRYIQSPFPLLGINNPAPKPEALAKV